MPRPPVIHFLTVMTDSGLLSPDPVPANPPFGGAIVHIVSSARMMSVRVGCAPRARLTPATVRRIMRRSRSADSERAATAIR